MMKRAYVLGSLIVALGGCAGAASPVPPPSTPAADSTGREQQRRIVTGSAEQMLGFWYWVSAECEPRDVRIRVREAPGHGALRFAPITGKTRFAKDSPRHDCNDRTVPATAIHYQAEPGFSGPDRTTLEIQFPAGGPRTVTYNISVWETPPARIDGANPVYPQDARRGGIEGKVIAWVHVDADGGVRKVEIRDSPNPLLSASVTEALSQWTFRPPSMEGKPVAFVGQYSVIFRLTDPEPTTGRI